jgi:hypothetical protein
LSVGGRSSTRVERLVASGLCIVVRVILAYAPARPS